MSADVSFALLRGRVTWKSGEENIGNPRSMIVVFIHKNTVPKIATND